MILSEKLIARILKKYGYEQEEVVSKEYKGGNPQYDDNWEVSQVMVAYKKGQRPNFESSMVYCNITPDMFAEIVALRLIFENVLKIPKLFGL